MDSNFPSCLNIILKEEGGNDDDPRDPGGRTSRGIIQREWNVFRQTHPNRPADVWKAAQADIEQIYHDQYWEPYCDRMPPGVDLMFFNTAVLSGRQQSVKELQRALGCDPADGMMGMITFNALDQVKGVDAIQKLIRNLSEQRRNYYRALKTFKTFGKGWLARTDRVQRAATDMAQHIVSKVVASDYPYVDTKPANPETTVSAKAPIRDADHSTVSPENAGTASATAGGLIAVLNGIKDSLAPFSTTINAVQYVLLAITIVGIGYTVWSLIKKNRIKAAVGADV